MAKATSVEEIFNRVRADAAKLADEKNKEAEAARKEKEVRHQELSAFKDGQLVLWPESERRAPNEVVRSALFTARDKRAERRIYPERTVIFSLGDSEVRYKGTELRALDDEAVWLQLLHYCREVKEHTPGEGFRVEFSSSKILRDLGWPLTKVYYEKLRNCIERMEEGVLALKSTRLRRTLTCKLIRKTDRAEGSAGQFTWIVWLEPEMLQLFDGVHYTKLAWDTYQSYGQNVIARRLDGWIRSHRAPLPVKIADLQRMMGSDSALRTFRQSIREAAELVKKAKVIIDWHIDDEDRLVVVRSESERLQSS